MIELLFLLGFSLHNIEEALWLPQWSGFAKKYHRIVGVNEFRFAVIVVTTLGYLVTFQYFIFSYSLLSRYIYLGFIFMMVFNAFFPHLVATVSLKRYAPGTVTGLLLNVPLGLYIIKTGIKSRNEILYVLSAGMLVSVIMLLIIKLLFLCGRKLFE